MHGRPVGERDAPWQQQAGTADVAGGERSVDLVHLARQTFGSRDLEREVLRLFIAQAPALIDRIRRAASADDRFRAAHQLKGSARGIGAWRVARLSEAVEHVERVPSEAPAICGQLAAAVDEADAFIRALLDDE